MEQAGGGTGEQILKSGSRRPAIPGLGLGRRPRCRLATGTRAASGLRPGTQRSPARSWLIGANAGKRGPTPQGERRSGAPRGATAGRSRPSSPAIRRWARPRGGPRVRRFRTSACRRSAPLIFSGTEKGHGASGALSKPAAERWLDRSGDDSHEASVSTAVIPGERPLAARPGTHETQTEIAWRGRCFMGPGSRFARPG